jgi:hypothetical protein
MTPASPDPLSESEYSDLVLSVGTHHKTRVLKPTEVARRIRKTLDSGVKSGEQIVSYTPESLAKVLGLKGPTMLSKFLGLLTLPEEFRGLVEWGSGKGDLSHLTFTTASMLNGLSEADQRQFLSELFKHDLTKAEMQSAVQAFKRNRSVSIEEAVQIALSTRPIKVQHELLVGEFAPDSPFASETIPTGRKEAVLAAVLRPILHDEAFAARISESRFVISTSAKGKKLLDTYAAEQKTDLNTLVQKFCEERLAH